MNQPVYHLENVVHSRETLENFDGPLDLILSLLSKNKMEIQDIQIALILDQYMDWMHQRQEMDLDVASEFVTMASQLVYIKTRMLLSIHDEEALSEMEALIASLEERKRSEDYARVKTVVPDLSQRYAMGVDYIAREQMMFSPDKTYRYQHEPKDLARAMELLRERNGQKLPPPVTVFHGIVGREPFPVAEKAREILQQLLVTGVTRFRRLFRGSQSRSELVATFLAVLELCRSHRIHLVGSDEDCTVTRTVTRIDAKGEAEMEPEE